MGRYVVSLLALGLLSLEAGSFVFPLARPSASGTVTRGAAALERTRACPPVSHRTAGRGVVLQSTTDKVGWFYVSQQTALITQAGAVILVQTASEERIYALSCLLYA